MLNQLLLEYWQPLAALLVGLFVALLYGRGRQLALEASLAAERKQQQQLQQELQQRQQQLDELQQQQVSLNATIATLKAEQHAAGEKLQILQQAKQQLATEFENLANRIFNEKQQRFAQSSQQTIDGVLSPLRQQLKDFRQRVDEVYDRESRERITLAAQLDQLKQLNQQMSEEAINLTRALKGDNKAQGNWGEVILERLLEQSGLRKGSEYSTQVALKTAAGGTRNPDVIVHLPEQRDIIIDAKVSLIHYERYCNAEQDEERRRYLKQHVLSVREHINGLSRKDYESLEGVRSLDFVFIFIPIEAAFLAAFETEPDLFREAYDRNIIVTGPTTLLATLRTVQSIWRYERQNRNAEEIARQAGTLHDKFVGFVADLDKIADYLAKATDAHSSAMKKLSTGRDNLVSKTQRLEKLGARTRKKLNLASLPEQEDDALTEMEPSESNE